MQNPPAPPMASASKMLPRQGPVLFSVCLALNFLLRIAIGFLEFPLPWLSAANVVVSILFVGLPIFALYFGADHPWDWRRALALTLFGIVIQVSGISMQATAGIPLVQGACMAASQAGLIMWCLGIGAFLASILKDKNLLLPIGIFLALFDIWLVFVPEGPVGQIARGNQQALARIAYQVPQAVHVSTSGLAAPHVYIGPADFLFMGMFFVALFRFGMRTRATLITMIPVLVIYLFTVLVFGNIEIGPISLRALPALVPIGAVVLGVNWREFQLTKDEKQTTIAVAIIGLAVLVWRFVVAGPTPPHEHPQPARPMPTVSARR